MADRRFIPLFILLAGCGLSPQDLRGTYCGTGLGHDAARPGGYDQIVYEEQFDADTFPANLSRIAGLGFPAPADPSAELQLYRPENISIVHGAVGDDGATLGAMSIHATWDTTANQFFSGMMVSSATHCPMQTSRAADSCAGSTWGSGASFATTPQQGVFVEICAKAPLVGGNWPALWMLRDDGSEHWPPELDLLEIFPTRPKPACQTQIYGDVASPLDDQVCAPHDPSRFHSYGALWDPANGKVEFRLDGVRIPMPDAAGFWADASKLGFPAYFIANNALSSVTAGDFPSAQGESEMLIDYVRVFTNGPELVRH